MKNVYFQNLDYGVCVSIFSALRFIFHISEIKSFQNFFFRGWNLSLQQGKVKNSLLDQKNYQLASSDQVWIRCEYFCFFQLFIFILLIRCNREIHRHRHWARKTALSPTFLSNCFKVVYFVNFYLRLDGHLKFLFQFL